MASPANSGRFELRRTVRVYAPHALPVPIPAGAPSCLVLQRYAFHQDCSSMRALACVLIRFMLSHDGIAFGPHCMPLAILSSIASSVAVLDS
jgi:hypothetical protein